MIRKLNFLDILMNQCVCSDKGESLAYKRPWHEFFMLADFFPFNRDS